MTLPLVAISSPIRLAWQVVVFRHMPTSQEIR
jgi:hypothetical protein